MENTMKMCITADEVAELLGVSRGYRFILLCLQVAGYIVILKI